MPARVAYICPLCQAPFERISSFAVHYWADAHTEEERNSWNDEHFRLRQEQLDRLEAQRGNNNTIVEVQDVDFSM